MPQIRLTDDQLQTPDGAELAQICRAILRPGKLDLNGIKALRKWLRAHFKKTKIPAILYLTDLMERIAADGFINQKELTKLEAALIAVLPEAHRRSTTPPPPPPKSDPEPWWNFEWMPKWGWWAFGSSLSIPTFVLLLAMVQGEKEIEPADANDDAAAAALKERLEEVERQLEAQKKQTAEKANKSKKQRPQGNIPQGFEQIKDAVVRIDANDPNGPGHGTGFVVANDVIVTNHHVAGYSSKAEITFRDGTKVQADGKLHLDKSKDLAVLRVRQIPRSIKPIKLFDGNLKELQIVVAMGHPIGFEHTYSSGEISALPRDGEVLNEQFNRPPGYYQGQWVQHNADISQGNSGGPLIDMQGNAVGMNTLFATRGQNLNFAISSKDILSAIQDAKFAPLAPFKPHNPNDVLARFIGEWHFVYKLHRWGEWGTSELTIEFAVSSVLNGDRVQLRFDPQEFMFYPNGDDAMTGDANDLIIQPGDDEQLKAKKNFIGDYFKETERVLTPKRVGDSFVIEEGPYTFSWDPRESLLRERSNAGFDKRHIVYKFFNENSWGHFNRQINGDDGVLLLYKARRKGVSIREYTDDLQTEDVSPGGRPALDNIEQAIQTKTFWDELETQNNVVILNGKPFSGWAQSNYGIVSDISEKLLLGKFEDGALVRIIRWQADGVPEFDLNFDGASLGYPGECYFWEVDLQDMDVPYAENLDGMCTEWHANGKKREQSWFVNGKPNRLHHGWYENGEKQYDFNWRSGKAHGTFRQYHKNGQLSHEGRHNEGKLVEVKSWLTDGKPCRLTRVTDGSGRWVNRYADESIEVSSEYWDGELHGSFESYYLGGQLRLKLSYNNGKIEGDAWRWHDNGQKFFEGIYHDNERHGEWIFWHPNGQKSAQGDYAAGKEAKGWSYWDKNGDRVTSQQEQIQDARQQAREKIDPIALRVTVTKEKLLFHPNKNKNSCK